MSPNGLHSPLLFRKLRGRDVAVYFLGQILADIVRLSNSVSQTLVQNLDYISEEEDVLSLDVKTGEFVDTDDVPLLSEGCLNKINS